MDRGATTIIVVNSALGANLQSNLRRACSFTKGVPHSSRQGFIHKQDDSTFPRAWNTPVHRFPKSGSFTQASECALLLRRLCVFSQLARLVREVYKMRGHTPSTLSHHEQVGNQIQAISHGWKQKMCQGCPSEVITDMTRQLTGEAWIGE